MFVRNAWELYGIERDSVKLDYLELTSQGGSVEASPRFAVASLTNWGVQHHLRVYCEYSLGDLKNSSLGTLGLVFLSCVLSCRLGFNPGF